MGYESRLYICEMYETITEGGVQYAPPIAMFDLCKMGYETPFGRLLSRHPAPSAPRYYFYGEDGNTPIKQDRYGENLRVLPIVEVVEAIQAHIKQSEAAGEVPYRRLMPLYALLAAFQHCERQWRTLVVLHYGY